MGAKEELNALRAEFNQQEKPQLSPRQELDLLRQEMKGAQAPQENAPSEGYIGAGIIEPAAAIASGLGSMAAGGIAGAYEAINPYADEGAGAQKSAEIQEAGTFVPRTEAGKEGLEAVGGAMQGVVDAVNYPISGIGGLVELISGQGIDQAMETLKNIQEQGTSKTLGDRVYDETGSPLAATVGRVIPEAAADLIGAGIGAKAGVQTARTGARAARAARGAGGAGAAGAARGAYRLFTEQSAFKQKIANDIAAGSTDRRLAKYIIDGRGNVKNDPRASEAIKQGFDEGVISAIKGSAPADKSKMSKMVEIVDRGRKNALYASKNRPSDVAGSSLIERVDFVKKVNREAGDKIDVVAKSLKGQEVDSAAAINNFINGLDEMGVRIGNDFKPSYKGSDIEGISPPQMAINKLVKRMTSGRRGQKPDAYELHRMKRYIDEIVTYGKSGDGLSGKTERIIKKLRSDLDGALDNKFAEYDAVNTAYADTIGALNDLQNVAGKKMDLSGANASKATGTLLRRMLSNAQSRVNLIDSIDSLEAVSKKYGGDFADDLATQVLFVDELGAKFGAAAKSSLQGDFEKVMKKAGESKGRTIPDLAVDAAILTANKLRNVNDDAAIKSIKDLLN